METLYRYINLYTPISITSWNSFKELLVYKKYKKGAMLCDFNTTPNEIFYLKKGFARAYTLDFDGGEFNLSLYTTNQFIASFTALIRQSKADVALECLTDCETYVVKFNELQPLLEVNKELRGAYSKLIETYLINLEFINIQRATLTGTERYKRLKKRFPNIDNEIAQFHIASNIGVTPIQLSRIRKKLYGKNNL